MTGLFLTCLVDIVRPGIGFATLDLLKRLGVEPVVPATQTCCGQPSWTAGCRGQTREMALKCVKDFAGCDRVVVPSGSCAATFRKSFPEAFAPDDPDRPEVVAFAGKCSELTEFLDDMGYEQPRVVDGRKVTYHDSCSGLRTLGIKAAPRRLLGDAGYQVVEMPDCENCCGFGGAFSTSFGEVSSAILDKKVSSVVATDADAVVLGDLGCMLNIEGRLSRIGRQDIKVLHIAEALVP